MDMISNKLGMDPLEIRLKNILKEGDANAIGEKMHSVGSEECLKKVTRYLEWEDKGRTSKGVWKGGKGIALGNKYSSSGIMASCCFVKVHDDGTIEIRQSGTDLGQGQHTILTQIAAEDFDTSLENIIVVPVDTDYTPFDSNTGSQRQTFYMGNAVRLACKDAKRQIFELASQKLKADPNDLEIRNSRIFVKETPKNSIPLGDIFLPGGFSPPYLPVGGEILGKATFRYPMDSQDMETGQCPVGGLGRVVAFYTQVVHGVEVEVNLETGQVRIVKFIGAADVGRAINPLLVEGQMEAALSQGVGSALLEELLLDNGKIINPNLVDYKIPSTLCVPQNKDVKTIIVESYHRDGPFGAKGVGEAVIVSTLPAVANAIYDAVGIRIKEAPFTPEKILNALREKRQT
jgi:CO/xanthine dehydrogenase Mo-binding subunit